MADSAPVLIWMSGLDKRCTFFNKPWLDFTGRRMEQELGDGWAEGVHPEDLEGCMKAYSECFDAHQPFVLQYRLKRHDGEYRWLSDSGVPRYDAQGNFAGYIGSCVDFTERKTAEERLQTTLNEVQRLHAISYPRRTRISGIRSRGEIGSTFIPRREQDDPEDAGRGAKSGPLTDSAVH